MMIFQTRSDHTGIDGGDGRVSVGGVLHLNIGLVTDLVSASPLTSTKRRWVRKK